MDNKTHKELVIDQAKDIFAKIDALPLHSKNKIMLYSRYLLSKVSWHLTVADLTKTWAEQNLDSLYDESNRITNELMSSGLVLRSMWNFSLSTARKYWYTAFENLPENIYNFTLRYMNNTLPTMKNMKMWEKLYSSDCKFCQQTQTLGNVVGGCISPLRVGRYNWRHDSIIVNMAKFITALKTCRFLQTLTST